MPPRRRTAPGGAAPWPSTRIGPGHFPGIARYSYRNSHAALPSTGAYISMTQKGLSWDHSPGGTVPRARRD